jgi:hypothetical protein
MTDKDFPTKQEWEAQQARDRTAQNLGDNENAVPESRPQATIDPEPVTSQTQQRLREAESPMADNAPPHGYEEHKRAASDAQAKKAASESFGRERLYPGAHAYIDNENGEGSEHHGRAVAVNAVSEFASVEDERISAAGNPNSRFAEVKSYECRTRDGRAELMIVDADHLRTVDINNFHPSVT